MNLLCAKLHHPQISQLALHFFRKLSLFVGTSWTKKMPHLLHGTLFAVINGVDRLDTGSGCPIFCGKDKRSGKKLLHQFKRFVLCRPELVRSKLYATVDLDKARVGRTRVIENQPSSPQWDESFHIYCAHYISYIIFTVKEDDPISATLIGRAYVPVEAIIKGYAVDRWVEILDQEHNPIHGGSKIHVKLQFFDVKEDGYWSRGIRTPLFEGVPYCFFRQRSGCRVSLYQDAHVSDNFIDHLGRSGGLYPELRRCWEDIFDGLMNAKHLIYITGWSVYTKITLVRDPTTPKPGGDMTLGELLIKKANEGVTVLMLVWDDRTSIREFKRVGKMETHDQETEEFFRNTKVHCFLCPRNPDDGLSIVQGFEIATMFTHHQKTVVVDAEVSGEEFGKRRIVSFVGGIDLCDGRYDSQEHPLFSTLSSTHRDDFHQPNFSGSSIQKGGPREPWHDIHCRLEGPVAWDVLYNFEQRWLKQIGNKLLIPLWKLDEIIVRPSPILLDDDPEVWNVQIFRSIDGGAAFGFPEKPDEATSLGLVTGKDNTIDRSIQDAYINAIRRAKNFVYIENQYFIGSSFGWKSSDIKVEDIGALHLIPKELSLKVVSKIEAGERFAVYVVIPMWPEGIPESGPIQAMLDWQRRTMEMMYADISEALRRKGLDSNPRDFLTFFCLGNRELINPGEYVPTEKPEPESDYIRAQEARRFMIYVHAKMMIVDDEYIIIGSANINERSMQGGRDSEICMGAFQPHHLGREQGARGQIFKFRMSLWMEHLGLTHSSFQHPESLSCVHLVNAIAQESWEVYSSNTSAKNLSCHLLPFPIEVDKDGSLSTLPGVEFFPDTKAPVLGTMSEYLPPILTT